MRLALLSLTAAVLLEPTAASAWVFGNADSNTTRFGMSGNGRYVTFQSVASNLVPNDTNGVSDVFRLDTQTGQVVRVSVDSSGNQGNGNSNAPSINFDGTRVAFLSGTTNLVTGDTNGVADIFVRDLSAGTTTRVSVDSSGNQSNNGAIFPSINSGGTKVAFLSSDSNLVADDTNDCFDVFVHDLSAGTTVRASVDSSGIQGNLQSLYPSISADGTRVAFPSEATNLVAADTNGVDDVFVRDLSAGTTIRVSVSSSGTQGNGPSNEPSINSDGTKIAFGSDATNLVSGDAATHDIFVRNLSAGTTTRVRPVDPSGNQATNIAQTPSISADGTRVAFSSIDPYAVAGDTNYNYDIFVHDLSASTTVLASVNSSGIQAYNHSFVPSISADGTRVAFHSYATNLVANDTNGGIMDVFVHDLSSGSTTVPVTVSGFEFD